MLDPTKKKIKYKRKLVKPLKLIWKGKAEIILPIENIKSMDITMEPFKVINYHGTKPEERELPFLTMTINKWEGDEKLLKKMTSKKEKERIKVISNKNIEVLNKMKELLVNYARNRI